MADQDDQEAATWRAWTNLLGRVRFGKQKVNGKTVSAFTIKAIAGRLATYADHRDGTRIRPGVARIAVDLETSYTTVRNAITVLERVGLIRLVTPGNKNRPAVYRLVIGEELIDQIEVWTPPRYVLEIEREAVKYRSPKAQTTDSTGVSGETEPLTPQGSVEGRFDHRTTDAVGTEIPEPLTPQGVFPLTPQASAHQVVISHQTDQPESGDLRTELAVARASRPPCVHGNSSRKRRDGEPRCDECRTAETHAAIADVRLSPARCEHGLKIATNVRGEVACFACRRGIPA
ncbi:hypothetical protein [Lysinibacillus fusiformis]|uniref:hypothetical protein n=1 Tax=Lysinibacillus fusiformis TaxID=28031 RepID=UPI003D04C567